MRTMVLFVCYGNICRSPIAEFVFRDMVTKAGLSDSIECASCATSADHLGDGVDPRSEKVLAKHGISCAGKTARRITRGDFGNYDYIIGMDSENMREMRKIFDGDPEGKLRLLLDFTDKPTDIADPWYTGDFETTYRDISLGCTAFLDKVSK